ncbi:restriction endonuclease [Kribbella sp. NPDC023855]|uniref:restriction endonuclease n=1 Tax=Kribbella sp. NPDC023855 TaxID=3154698 RepID=UPI0033F2B52A
MTYFINPQPTHTTRVSRLEVENLRPMTPEWKVYQEQVAKLFADLGFTTTVDERLTGARGSHEIDVVARTTAAGIEQVWVIECKRWHRAIPKERVLTLQTIVADVGADRGLMFCEKGFQAGAIRAARNTNITLTSIEDFSRNNAEEMQLLQIRGLEERLELLAQKYTNLWDLKSSEQEMVFSRYAGPSDILGRNGPISLQARLSQMSEAMERARHNRWPAWYHPLDDDGTSVIRVLNRDALLMIVEPTVVTCERIYEQMTNTEIPMVDWRELQPPELIELLNAIRGTTKADSRKPASRS